MVVATSAQAATPTAPTLTLTAPAQLVNNNSAVASGLNLRVNNTVGGNAAVVGGTLSVTIGGIAALPCGDITLTPANTGPSSAGIFASPALSTSSVTAPCVYSAAAFAQDANTDVTYNYTIAVNAPAVVGTLTGQASFTEPVVPATVPPTNVTSSSNTTSTSLVNPSVVNPAAPAFSTAAVPNAIVFRNYSFTEATNVGTPAASFYAFGTHKNSDGTYRSTTRTVDTEIWIPGTDTVPGHYDDAIELNSVPQQDDCCPYYVFDVDTGKILGQEVPDMTDSVRYWTWTIVGNNGTGGATVAVPPIGPGSATLPTPGTSLHDVFSPSFTLPVLFSDVALNRTFAKEIYELSDGEFGGASITGFADGTFRPGLAVQRQAFVAMLVPAELRAPCNPAENPSPFSDVPNANPFCAVIEELYQDGVIKGYPDGTFHPGENISRQALSAYLYRLFTFNSHATPGDAACTTPIPFNDVKANNPFCGDIEWMAKNGISTGFADGGYHPGATATRQDVAVFIDRLVHFEIDSGVGPFLAAAKK